MVVFVTVIHVLVSLVMMLFILLQEGKEGMGSIGGGVGASAFGSRSRATPLSRLTAVAAGTFMVTSLTLAWLSSRDTSVIGSAAIEKPAATAPATAGEQPAEGAGAESAAPAQGEAAPAEGAAQAAPAAPTAPEAAPSGEAPAAPANEGGATE